MVAAEISDLRNVAEPTPGAQLIAHMVDRTKEKLEVAKTVEILQKRVAQTHNPVDIDLLNTNMELYDNLVEQGKALDLARSKLISNGIVKDGVADTVSIEGGEITKVFSGGALIYQKNKYANAYHANEKIILAGNF